MCDLKKSSKELIRLKNYELATLTETLFGYASQEDMEGYTDNNLLYAKSSLLFDMAKLSFAKTVDVLKVII